MVWLKKFTSDVLLNVQFAEMMPSHGQISTESGLEGVVGVEGASLGRS